MKNIKQKIFVKLLLILILFTLIFPKITSAVAEVNNNEKTLESMFSLLKQEIFKSSSSGKEEIVYTPDYLKYLSLSDEEKAKYAAIPEPEFVSVEDFNLKNGPLNSSSLGAAAPLPSSYNLRNIININVENQGSTGWCWAYADLKILETYLLKTRGVEYNFSEGHLANMRAPYFGGWDSNIASSSNVYNNGGNFYDFKTYSGLASYSDYAWYMGTSQLVNSNKPIQGAVLASQIYNQSYSFTPDSASLLKNSPITAKVTKTIEFPYINKVYDGNRQVSSYNIQDNVLNDVRNRVKEHIMNYGRSLWRNIISRRVIL